MPYELVPLTKAKSQIEMSNDDLVRLSKFGLGRDVIQKIYTMLDDDGDFVFRLISSSLKPDPSECRLTQFGPCQVGEELAPRAATQVVKKMERPHVRYNSKGREARGAPVGP